MSYFEVLQLPERYALDPALLEERYRAESRLWHPDRHGRASPAERTQVLQRATDLNEAYRVLKSDQRRGEYLLRRRGVDLDAEVGPGRVQPAQGFLMTILELREQLQDLQRARDEAGMHALEADVRSRVRQDRAAVAARFAELEGDGAPREALSEATQALVRLRYYQRFLDEITAYEEGNP